MAEKDQSLFDDILDTNLNDVEDLPEYMDYCPTGSFVLEIVKSELGEAEVDHPEEKGKKMIAPVIRVEYEVHQVQELAKEEEAQLVKAKDGDKAGSRFSESFFLHKDKKKSLEIFKAKYKEIALKIGNDPDIRTMLSQMKGMVVTSQVSSTKNKNDSSRFFINTKNIQVV